VRQSRTAAVLAWRVGEGDISPSGAQVVSVQRDPSRRRVRLGFSDGGVLHVAADRRVVVLMPVHPGRSLLPARSFSVARAARGSTCGWAEERLPACENSSWRVDREREPVLDLR
jgi:hypothetical protein